MPIQRYLNVVRASAIYDLLMTFPFALPGLAAWYLAQFDALHRAFLLSGDLPHFEPLHLFFVNLMGSLVIVWSLLRLLYPQALFGLFDSVARFLFSFSMFYYVMFQSATSILWVMLVPEIAWGIVQLWGYLRLNMYDRSAQ